MSMGLNAMTITLLEKIAADNGFDRELPRQNDWLGFASTQAPLQLWLTTFTDSLFIAALSQHNVARSLGAYGTPLSSPLPKGAVAGRSVVDIAALNRLVRRALQLSKALPDELMHAYHQRIAKLPQSTEAERLVVQRVGPEVFREGLLDYWEGRCAITGLAVPELLRASHIKPWADCESDAERLDVFNGLLLAPNLDAAFDRGFMTVEDDGSVIVAGTLGEADRRVLGLDVPLRIRALAEGHRAYLPWHRDKVFLRRPVRSRSERGRDV